MADTFAGTISAWAVQERDRMEAIFHTAAQTAYTELRTTVNQGGRLPHDTGNLRRSFMASTAPIPSRGDDQTEFPDYGPESEMVIANAPLGSTIHIGSQAAYAARMNYGFVGTDSLGRVYNQAGFGFLDAAQQRWPQIVKEAEAKVRGRFDQA